MKFRELLRNFRYIFAFILIGYLAGGSAAAQTGAPKQEKLLNGLNVLMWPDPSADRVSIRIRIHSGASFDPQGKEGVMYLLAENIFPNEGTKEFFSEDLGGSLEIDTHYDYIELRATSKPDSFLTLLETVSAAVSNPPVDKDTTSRLKKALEKKLEESRSDPAYIADTAVASRLFGTFPYGRPIMGTADSVKKIDFADLIDAKQRFFTADNATIAVTGNFERTLGFRAIRRYFGSWLKSDKKVPSTFKHPDPPPADLEVITSPLPSEAAVRFAFRGTARNDKDFAASQVFTQVIENRLTARVPEVHSKSVFAANHAHILPGFIVVGFSAGDNELAQGPGTIGQGELFARSISEPVTDAEFQTAKASVKAEWAKRDLVSFWLDGDTYRIAKPGSEPKAIDAVTLAEVRAYAEKAAAQPRATVLVNPKK